MTTIRQLESRDFHRAASYARANLAVAGSEPAPDSFGKPRAVSGEICQLPGRPDAAILSNAIPFFYIGRNRHGFWVAREAEGKIGGLFMCQRSALRFARKLSKPLGCATMLLNGPFELDIANHGSRIAVLLTAALEIATRRLPTVASFVGLAAAEWRKLVAEVSRAVAGERRNRAAVERELFDGHYRLSSKSDDDLPVL
jgi:hypothetical protein